MSRSVCPSCKRLGAINREMSEEINRTMADCDRLVQRVELLESWIKARHGHLPASHLPNVELSSAPSSDEKLSSNDNGNTKARVKDLVESHNGLTIAEIAKRLDLNRSYISTFIKRMGFRESRHPDDGRVRLYHGCQS